MNKLYNWVFHFNPHTNLWNAVTRDNYNELFSGGKNVLRSKEINTLIKLITKLDGYMNMIEECLDTKPILTVKQDKTDDNNY